MTAVPGTVLFLPATSPATLLDDASGTGAVVTGAGGEAYSTDFPAGVSCGGAPTAATASATSTPSSTSTPLTSNATRAPIPVVVVTGAVVDSSSGATLSGVTVTGGSGSAVLSGPNGTYYVLAPVVNGRIVVSTLGFRNYPPASVSSVYFANVSSYTITIVLTPFSVAFAVNNSGFTTANITGAGRPVGVRVPPFTAPIAYGTTLNIAVLSPATGPGLLETDAPGNSTNSTMLQVCPLRSRNPDCVAVHSFSARPPLLQTAGMFYVGLRDAAGGTVPFPGDFAPIFSFPNVTFTADVTADPLAWCV